MTAGRRAALLLLLAFALPALALLAKLPKHPLILGVLNDAAHAPVFGALAVVIHALLRDRRSLDRRQRYLVAFIITVVIGGLVERIQPLFGRGPEWFDLLNDGLGAVAGLAIVALCRTRATVSSRLWPAGVILAVAAVPVLWPIAEASAAYGFRSLRFPVLFVASSHFDRYFLGKRSSSIQTQLLPAKWQRAEDPQSLRVEFGAGRWPGISLREPEPDWGAYSRLLVDVTNPDEQPLALTIRVHDRAHNNDAADRYSRQIAIAPGRQTIAIPLDEIARGPARRRLELSEIAGLIVHGTGNPEEIGRVFYLTQVWLD